MTRHDSPMCRDFSQTVYLLLGDELPDSDRTRWQRHLSDCPSCRRELAQARAVLEAYHALPEQDAPEALIREVVSVATAAPGWDLRHLATALRDRLRIRWLWRPALAAAALGALLFFGLNRQEEANLTWEPLEMEVTIARLDSTLTFYQEEITPDSQTREGSQLWDEEAEALQERIASLMHEIDERGL